MSDTLGKTENHFIAVCGVDELWDDEMDAFEAGDMEVLLVRMDGKYRAFQSMCPHQAVSLADGKYEDGILTCSAHLWQFDIETGLGVNPTDTCLKTYPVRIEGGEVFVDISSGKK